jgi:hypothetical protein
MLFVVVRGVVLVVVPVVMFVFSGTDLGGLVRQCGVRGVRLGQSRVAAAGKVRVGGGNGGQGSGGPGSLGRVARGVWVHSSPLTVPRTEFADEPSMDLRFAIRTSPPRLAVPGGVSYLPFPWPLGGTSRLLFAIPNNASYP